MQLRQLGGSLSVWQAAHLSMQSPTGSTGPHAAKTSPTIPSNMHLMRSS